MTSTPASGSLDGTNRQALLIVRAEGGSVNSAAVAAAREAGWLIVEVETFGVAAAWRGDALPGRSSGCFVRVGARDVLQIRTDSAGQFLISVADLLLRSNSVGSLHIEGETSAELMAALDYFCRRHGYDMRAFEPAAATATVSAPVPSLLPDLASRVARGNAALVLIDVQNDFCAAEGATGRGGQPMGMIRQAVDRIKLLLAAAREAGIFVVHVRAEYGELYRHVGSPYRFPAPGGREPAVWTASAADLSDGKKFPTQSVEVCLPESWGGEFVDGIVPLPGEAVVTKHRFSAFAGTGLDLLLRANGIKSVVVAGVTTNCCVETTSREAVMRDFYLVVAKDCVAVKDHLRDLHDATLESLGLYFGLVRPSAEIMDLWRRGAEGSARAGVAA